jgi:hypothetical protein
MAMSTVLGAATRAGQPAAQSAAVIIDRRRPRQPEYQPKTSHRESPRPSRSSVGDAVSSGTPPLLLEELWIRLECRAT